MGSDEAYEKAKKKVDAKIGFYIHLAVYIGVNVLLVIINFATIVPPETKCNCLARYWFIWPLFGWGIGIVFHAAAAFIFSNGADVKQRMIEKEMKKQAPDKE